MLNNKGLALIVGESLIEVSHLLRNTFEIVKQSNCGSESDIRQVEDSIARILDVIDAELLTSILRGHPELQRVAEWGLRETGGGTTGPKSEKSTHLEFADRNTAILSRQAILNVRYLLDRLCAIYVTNDSTPDSEKRLHKLRIGQTLAGPLSDTLDDLFIAHPDLAVGGFEEFDWSRAKLNRAQKE